ncbi:hypothetical protein ACH5AL_28770 [Actinacidiphila glaucinigra]|uniref:hypothetical protein n=1 Tax=Actinacidiphila glaucinigra TaxID=235986 RepID=UPI00378EB3DD
MSRNEDRTFPARRAFGGRARQWVALTSTAVTALVAAASPASATAVGYGKVGSFCFDVKGVQLCAPGATIGHVIKGNGLSITREEASVQDIFGADSAGGKWCNWRIDWRYSDTDGKTYLIRRGPMHQSCTFMKSVGRVDDSRRTLKHYGKACADFFASGQKRGTQCHNIVK